MTIRRIGVWSAARIGGVVYAALGLLVGAVFSLASLAGAAMGQAIGGEGGAAGALVGMLVGIGAVVVFPVLNGTMGLIGGALGAFIYNLAAKPLGGLELEIEMPSSGRAAGAAPRTMAAYS